MKCFTPPPLLGPRLNLHNSDMCFFSLPGLLRSQTSPNRSRLTTIRALLPASWGETKRSESSSSRICSHKQLFPVWRLGNNLPRWQRGAPRRAKSVPSRTNKSNQATRVRPCAALEAFSSQRRWSTASTEGQKATSVWNQPLMWP